MSLGKLLDYLLAVLFCVGAKSLHTYSFESQEALKTGDFVAFERIWDNTLLNIFKDERNDPSIKLSSNNVLSPALHALTKHDIFIISIFVCQYRDRLRELYA